MDNRYWFIKSEGYETDIYNICNCSCLAYLNRCASADQGVQAIYEQVRYDSGKCEGFTDEI